MPHSTELAKSMLVTKLESLYVPSPRPTNDTESLVTAWSPRSHSKETILFRKQRDRTYCFIVTHLTYLTTTVLLGLIFFFVLLDTFVTMKRIYLAESKLQIPGEKINRTKQSRKCVVPANPEHSIYDIIANVPGAKPGDRVESLKLTITCLPGYGVLETERVFCVDGLWSQPIPQCVRVCKLDNNPSVHYRCLVTGSIEGIRTCNAYEPVGTVVKPECNSSKHSVVGLPLMRCINGSWNYVAVCSPASECGQVTSNDVDLVTRRPAERIEMPWHVGIYRKTTEPYMQICGGSLISNGLVISAAHCFWNETIKLLPASRFAVAAGKIYNFWNDRRDVDAQKSDIKEINIPPRFQGSTMNFQDDIAVLMLETPFEYTPFVRPVCLNFDVNLETRQLQPGEKGKVAGWGPTAEHGEASQALKVVELSYVGIKQCIAAMRRESREYLTSDKICASNGNDASLCRGDSGGGLVFPVTSEHGTSRYYLRGIVSISPKIDNFCNSYSLTTFTQILAHEHFLMQFLIEPI